MDLRLEEQLQLQQHQLLQTLDLHFLAVLLVLRQLRVLTWNLDVNGDGDVDGGGVNFLSCFASFSFVETDVVAVVVLEVHLHFHYHYHQGRL